MATELIPVVDLRVLSQSELATLALSSPNAFDLRRCDDVVVPKIDRSVFNESAGSRKQTYSRLRLDPPKTDSLSPSIPRRRGRPRSIPLRTTAAAAATNSAAPSGQPQNDPDHRENLLVASFLRRLFSREDPSSQTLTTDKAVSSVSANETNEGWRNILAAAEEAQKALVLAEDVDRESLTPKGVPVDLVLLGQMEEPFGEEMRRKTHGLTTEGQLLEFLSGLEGQWGSRRKRRKFVDACVFGDVLPRGWKLLLGLKRKEGVAWLDCRRYVSPKGYQFVSCKEVSSYILSLQGSMRPVSDREDDNTHSSDKVINGSNVGQVHQSIISNRSSSLSSATPVSYLSGNHPKQTEGTTCYYATPISYISCENEKQQMFSSHQRSGKRRRRGKMIVDGVILKDGKYECQFCHKTFSERHRYTGHIGAHVRYQGLTAETLLDETSTTKSTDQSSWAIVPYTSSENDVSAMKIDELTTIQCVTEEHVVSTTGGHAEISIANSCDVFHTEEIVEEEIAIGIKCNDCVDNKFPSACDMNTTSQKYSPMIQGEASASKPVDSGLKDCGIPSSNTKGDDDAKIFEEVKHNAFSDSVPLLSTHLNKDIPKAPDVFTFSSSISNSFNMLPVSTHVEDALCKINGEIDAPSSSLNKPKDADSPFLTLDAAYYHADEVVSFIPRSKSVDGTSLDAACVDNIAGETINENSLFSSPNKSDAHNKSDGNSIKHNSQNVDDTGKYMDVDTDLCYDLSLSLMDVDVKTNDKHNEINHPSSRLTSEFEKYNEKLMVEVQNHLITFSGNQSGITYDTYAKDISTHAVDGRVEKPTSLNGQGDGECCHSLSNKDAILMDSMHTLQTSSTVAPFSGEQTMDIEANTDCPFRTDINESVLEEIDKPVNELEFFFSGNNTMHERNAAGGMIGNDDASKALHISLANSSWIRGTNVLPVLDMLPDQCGIELDEISQKNGNLQGFEELRLGAIEPSDFALFTGQEPRSVVEPSMTMSYVSELDDQHCSSLQLGWNISLSNMDNTSTLTSVCVWCSTEFRHEHSSELQSETLGYICSACKAKFSGRSSVM